MNMATIINRQALAIAQVRAIHETAGNLLAALTRSGGEYSRNALWLEKRFDEALLDYFPDGNVVEAYDNLLHDMRSEGMLNSGSEFDASAKHPDAPGGW